MRKLNPAQRAKQLKKEKQKGHKHMTGKLALDQRAAKAYASPPDLLRRRAHPLTLRGARRHERSMKEKNKENHAKQLAQSKSRKEELKKQSEAAAEDAQFQRDMARAVAASNETKKTDRKDPRFF